MKLTYFSKVTRPLILMTLLSVIIGSIAQQSFQAQAQNRTQPKAQPSAQAQNQPQDLINCLPGFIDTFSYDFQGITFSPQQESAFEKLSAELDKKLKTELGPVQTDPKYEGGGLDTVMKEGLGPQGDRIAAEISEASSTMIRNKVSPKRQVELLTQKYGQYATFSTDERFLFTREQIKIREKLKREFNAQMMASLTPAQQIIYRANIESDRGLGTCEAGKTDSVIQQKPALSSRAKLTIAEIVSQSGGQYDTNPQDFDILLNALKQTGLADALADKKANLTVFAPTDAAFLKLSRFFGYNGNDEAAVLDTISKEFAKANQLDVANGGSDPNTFNLRNVLLYHVSSGAKTVDALQKLPGDKSMSTLLNYGDKPINANRISYINGNLIDAAPNLIAPKVQQNLKDIPASNGVIQGIDRVLFPYFLGGAYPVLSTKKSTPGQPATIADVLAQSGTDYDNNHQDFDILNKLLQTAEIADLFADPKVDLTLFAPTDAAFIELARLTTGGADQGSKDAESRAYSQVINFIQNVDQVTTQKIFAGGDAVLLLQKALQYHVSPGAKTAKEIRAASSLQTLLKGAAIVPKNGKPSNSSGVTNPQFQLGKTYIRTANGAIQSIDNVLVPSIQQIK
jgi:uncharacterized surface protein with fasciclin (FAS1) repeats